MQNGWESRKNGEDPFVRSAEDIIAELDERDGMSAPEPDPESESREESSHSARNSQSDRYAAFVASATLDLPERPEPIEEEPPLSFRQWPKPPEDSAFHGLAGEIVNMIAPHSEGDPVAILAQLLVGFGSMLNVGPHFLAESDRHAMNEFLVLVGRTSVGRKGTSWGWPRRILTDADPGWAKIIHTGLSSGEGLIEAVRDAVERRDVTKDGSDRVVVEVEGVSDKRLLVVESEFGRTLRVAGREHNTLTAVLRQAWETGDLAVMTKQRVRATGAHISVIAHVTEAELARCTSAVDLHNGFLNRFLICCVRRSKVLPEGGLLELNSLSSHAAKLTDALVFGRNRKRIGRTEAARRLWAEEYERLSEPPPGVVGALLSRGPAHVARLSCLYAILDKKDEVDRPHLKAALALFAYVERSVRYLFGDREPCEQAADRILCALRDEPDGLSRTEILENVFSNHISSGSLNAALKVLAEMELATPIREPTGGRPRTIWRCAKKARKASEAPKSEEEAASTSSVFRLSSLSSLSSRPLDPERDGASAGNGVCGEGETE